MSGGTGGSAGSGSLGVAGGMGGIGGGQFNPASMMAGQGANGMQSTQGMHFMPSLQGDIEPAFDHRAYLEERRAFRLAQSEQRKQRLAFRTEKQSKLVANRNRSRPGI